MNIPDQQALHKCAIMEISDSSSTSSKISSHHSSEGHDVFEEDATKLGTAKTIMKERFRSRSVSHTPPKIIASLSQDADLKGIFSHRTRPAFDRSISMGAQEYTESPSKHSDGNVSRSRSKSCTVDLLPLTDRAAKKPRTRKISTNSLGSFGRGLEGLLLAKPEVLISPVISREHSPDVQRKHAVEQEKEPEEGEEDGDLVEQKKVKSPHLDHGYAWVIVCGAGLAFFLGGGFGRCFPLIYQRLMERFQSSATATAWVAAMHGAVKLCSSPIVSALCNRFGIRAVVMSGGLVTASGLLMSAFPSSLSWIYLTYSTISAIGSNMVHAPSFIIIGQYFDKKKGTAMAIATTCLTLGGVAFAPLIEVFFTEYGYSGAMLLVSAIMLHYCVTGSLYRPPRRNQKATNPTNQKPADQSRDQESANQSTGFKLRPQPSANQMPDGKSHKQQGANQRSECTTRDPSSKELSASVAIRIEDDCENSNKRQTCLQKLLSGVLGGLKVLAIHLGLPLLRDLDCLGYGLLMGATFWAFGITNTFVAGLGLEIASIEPRDMAVMLSVTSATDIACRLASGVIFDAKKLKKHRVEMLLWIAALAGVSTALLPYATTYVSFFLCLALCSGMKSALHTQHVTVLAHLVGPRKLSSAMGLMRFFQGIGVMIGLATGGLLTDLLGTYSYAFTVGGVLLVLASAAFTSRHFCFTTKQASAPPTVTKTTPTPAIKSDGADRDDSSASVTITPARQETVSTS